MAGYLDKEDDSLLGKTTLALLLIIDVSLAVVAFSRNEESYRIRYINIITRKRNKLMGAGRNSLKTAQFLPFTIGSL